MYGFSVEVSSDFNSTIDRVTSALAEQGFGMISDIDLQAKFKEKLNMDHRPYRILGACNPGLAAKAVTAEPDIGLLLPCNVVVRETEKGCVVSFLDPQSVFSLVDNDGVAPLAAEVKQLLEAAAASLKNS